MTTPSNSRWPSYPKPCAKTHTVRSRFKPRAFGLRFHGRFGRFCDGPPPRTADGSVNRILRLCTPTVCVKIVNRSASRIITWKRRPHHRFSTGLWCAADLRIRLLWQLSIYLGGAGVALVEGATSLCHVYSERRKFLNAIFCVYNVRSRYCDTI